MSDEFIRKTAEARRVEQQSTKKTEENRQRMLVAFFIRQAEKEKVLEREEINELNNRFGGEFKFTKKNLKEMDNLYKEMYEIGFAACFRRNICAKCKKKMKKAHYTFICENCYNKMTNK